MKPLYLKISGLNSFREEQEVDFSNLCETGVFGIFGPTGSGKSTVLDAITLALYGKVERAERGTQGIINQNEDKAYVQFRFSIGGRKFSTERTYKRGSDNGVNQYSCRLLEDVNGENKVLAEKKRDMDEQIQKIIGLTAEDFTRAVVLPQGKFQEFLTLQGTERRKMLQRIFALEKYGEKLTQKIRSKLNNGKIKMEQVESRQSELGDASEKTVREAQKNLKEHHATLAELKKRELEIKKQHEDLKQVLEWQKELKVAVAKAEKLKIKEPEIHKKEEKLKLALKANIVKPFLDIVNNESINLEITSKRLKELKNEVMTSKIAFQTAEECYKQWMEKLSSTGEELKIKLVKLEEAIVTEAKRDELQKRREILQDKYREMDNINKKLEGYIKELDLTRKKLQEKKTYLNKKIEEKDVKPTIQEEIEEQRVAWQNLQEIEKVYAEIKKDIENKKEQIKEVSVKKDYLETQVGDAKKNLDLKEEELANLFQPTLSQNELIERNNTVNAFERIIITLEHHHQELEIKKQQLKANNIEKYKLEQSLKEYENKYELLSGQKVLLVEEINKVEQLLKQAERANLAAILSQQLMENQPCPVCGSLDHPRPFSQAEEDHNIHTMQVEFENKKADLIKLDEELLKNNQEQSIFKAHLVTLVDNIYKLNGEITTTEQKIKELFQQVEKDGTELNIGELKKKHDAEKNFLKETQHLIENYLSSREKLLQEINYYKDKFNQLNLKLKAEEVRKKALEEEFTGLTLKLDGISLEKEQKTNKFVALARGMSGQEILEKVQRMREDLQIVEKFREEEKKVIQELDKATEILLLKKDEKEKIQQQIETVINEGQICKRQVLELTEKINAVTKGANSKEVKQKVEENLKEINIGLDKSSKEMEKSRIIWEEKKTLSYSIQQELEQVEKRLEKARQDLDVKLQENHFVSQGQIEASFCTQEEIDQLTKEIEEFKKEKFITEKNIDKFTERLSGRSLSDLEWQEFQKKLTKTQRELETKVELVHKLEDRLETLEKNHIRWQELEEERKSWQSLIDKLSQLERLFRGNTFVEFIAEEQLMQVAINASRRLGELTQYRYALEVDSEGGFIIRDDANGGLRRPVTTLSGGETFLTSLALALALSSQIQLRGKYPLEFFFLDEGFGTLDSHLLETVMNSLERLHMEMTIGVISHVPELRSRMARKLVVEPAEKGGRGTRLMLETG